MREKLPKKSCARHQLRLVAICFKAKRDWNTWMKTIHTRILTLAYLNYGVPVKIYKNSVRISSLQVSHKYFGISQAYAVDPPKTSENQEPLFLSETMITSLQALPHEPRSSSSSSSSSAYDNWILNKQFGWFCARSGAVAIVFQLAPEIVLHAKSIVIVPCRRWFGV